MQSRHINTLGLRASTERNKDFGKFRKTGRVATWTGNPIVVVSYLRVLERVVCILWKDQYWMQRKLESDTWCHSQMGLPWWEQLAKGTRWGIMADGHQPPPGVDRWAELCGQWEATEVRRTSCEHLATNTHQQATNKARSYSSFSLGKKIYF